jgi:hypothetical protein
MNSYSNVCFCGSWAFCFVFSCQKKKKKFFQNVWRKTVRKEKNKDRQNKGKRERECIIYIIYGIDKSRRRVCFFPEANKKKKNYTRGTQKKRSRRLMYKGQESNVMRRKQQGM